jgi:DNA repair protein RecN (Recombination protein N)
MRSLSQITDLNAKYSEIYDRLSESFSMLDDVSDDVSTIIDELDSLDYNPDEIESRLDLIKSLKKKYGSSYAEINEFLEKAKQEKDSLENFEKLSADLLIQKENYSKKLYDLYSKLSSLRKEVSNLFTQNIKNELKELGMSSATFSVDFDDEPNYQECQFDSSNGFDKVTFMFSANLGEPLKPLSQVISGGEMSRFMLAIKVHTSKCNDISTFIFDEIDAGISGMVAKIVAQKFARISRNVQVVAITHLPQISSMADNNLLIEKTEVNEKTITNVFALSSEQKTKEIIRLIGGVDGENAVNLANEMIFNANEYKKSLS